MAEPPAILLGVSLASSMLRVAQQAARGARQPLPRTVALQGRRARVRAVMPALGVIRPARAVSAARVAPPSNRLAANREILRHREPTATQGIKRMNWKATGVARAPEGLAATGTLIN